MKELDRHTHTDTDTHTHTRTLLSHPHNSFPLLLWHLSVTQQHGWCFETNTRSSLEWVRLSGELSAAEYTSVCCDRSQGERECSLKLQGCWSWCFSGFGSELVKGIESKNKTKSRTPATHKRSIVMITGSTLIFLIRLFSPLTCCFSACCSRYS